MRAALITVLGLTLAGCATAPSAGTDTSAIAYRCRGGKTIQVAWGQPGRRAVVTAGGVTRSLKWAEQLSSVDYIGDKGERLWGGGDRASLTGFPGGPYQDCRAN